VQTKNRANDRLGNKISQVRDRRKKGLQPTKRCTPFLRHRGRHLERMTRLSTYTEIQTFGSRARQNKWSDALAACCNLLVSVVCLNKSAASGDPISSRCSKQAAFGEARVCHSVMMLSAPTKPSLLRVTISSICMNFRLRGIKRLGWLAAYG